MGGCVKRLWGATSSTIGYVELDSYVACSPTARIYHSRHLQQHVPIASSISGRPPGGLTVCHDCLLYFATKESYLCIFTHTLACLAGHTAHRYYCRRGRLRRPHWSRVQARLSFQVWTTCVVYSCKHQVTTANTQVKWSRHWLAAPASAATAVSNNGPVAAHSSHTHLEDICTSRTSLGG